MGDSKKPKKLKCSLCGELFEKEELIVKSAKRFCVECLKIRTGEAEKNKVEWTLLFEYICKLYKIDKPTGMMFQQMKGYRDDYSYTNIGMYYTLKYYHEILENTVLDGAGLGIIPYYYDKAKVYYNKMFDLQDVVENFENTENVINIKTKLTTKPVTKKEPLSLHIDWEEVNEDD